MYDNDKQEISNKYQAKAMLLRYVPFSQHVKKFYYHKAMEYSQAQYCGGRENMYDAIMSDA